MNAVSGHAGLVLWWPVILISVAVLWAALRILFLHRHAGVRVLSVLSRRITGPEAGLAAVAAVLNGYLIGRVFLPALDTAVYAYPGLPPHAGLAVMTGGILLMMIAQGYMGAAWRIGVPAGRQQGQKLITGGPFGISRNPVYVGVMGFLVGAVLLLPGPITLICFTAACWWINRLVRAEEAFMQSAFGAGYTAYCQRVRRWL